MYVSDVLKVSEEASYSVSWDDSVMIAAMSIVALETEAVLVVDRDGKVDGVFTGYNFITTVYQFPENDWATLYKLRCYDRYWRALSCAPSDPFESLLRKMAGMRWGHAVVHREGDRHSVIGVLDVARFLVRSGWYEKFPELKISEIATRPIVSVGVEESIYEVMRIMLHQRVRRVHVKGEDKIVTDRDVARFLLSKPTVDEFRENPQNVLRRPVNTMGRHMRRPVELEPDTSLKEAAEKLLTNEAYTIITSDKQGMLTPWDITIRIYERQTLTNI